MKKLNILIISRIIFPTNSPRAFRTTELAAELTRQGHQVTIYAVLGKHDYSDYEKKTGVKIRNIGKMLFSTINSDGYYRYTILDKILYHSLHHLIEFPDIELMFRVPHIIRKEKGVDMLITIAFPHPIHWGGALARKRVPEKDFPKTWVSDCGDPYMGDPMNKKKYFYFAFIEKWWARLTDYITVPNDNQKQYYYPEFAYKIHTIPQGFNFENVKITSLYKQNNIPVFCFSGSIYKGKRDPSNFFEFLTELNFNFKFIIYSNNTNFFSPYKVALKEKLEIRDYVDRNSLILELSKMDFLINIANNNNYSTPSKIIDYLISNRPILEISSDFKKTEQDNFMEFLKGNYSNQIKDISKEQFNIKNVAQKFTDLYNES